MLKGLEAIEISTIAIKDDNPTFRFDAEYYNKEALALIKHIKAGKHSILGQHFAVSKLAGFEFTEYYTEQALSAQDSYIALTSKNIQNEQLDLTEYITIDKSVADANLQRSKINLNDVVMSYTGEYRRSLVMQDKRPYQLGPNICRIRPTKSISPFYLSTFLNSSIGQTILDREKTLSAQPTVAMSRIRAIPIPLLSEEYEEVLHTILSGVYKKRLMADSLQKECDELLLKDINYTEIEDNSNRGVTISNSDVNHCNRWDAEYYKPLYQHIKELIKDYTKGYKVLGDICEIIDKNFKPQDEQIYKYIELANININGEINGYTECEGESLPSRARRKVRTGDVIVSSVEGSLTSCAIIPPELDGALCSTGFYVLRSDVFSPEVLLCIIKSRPIQLLLKKGCSGTLLTAISKNELEKIPLPIVDDQFRKTVVEKMSECIEIRKTCRQRISLAQASVKIAIYDGEAEAIKFLNQNNII